VDLRRWIWRKKKIVIDLHRSNFFGNLVENVRKMAANYFRNQKLLDQRREPRPA
jgi:hypothetical protein